MKKLLISLGVALSTFVCCSFAYPSIISPSYIVDGDDVKIYRTDNSRGGYLDVNLQNPETNDWLHFGEVKMSDQTFTYTKQWDGAQHIQIVPGDGGDVITFTIPKGSLHAAEIVNEQGTEDVKTTAPETPTRTVIPVVPKTGPSVSIIGIILMALAIFGGYIYIKKRADI